MYRASTPTHYFNIPFPAEDIRAIKLTYAQNGSKILSKTMDDLTQEDGFWKITLTQEETNKFIDAWASAQLRVLLQDGRSIPSDVFRIRVWDVLDDEVMV